MAPQCYVPFGPKKVNKRGNAPRKKAPRYAGGIIDHAEIFDEISPSRLTFGSANFDPIAALRPKRRYRSFRADIFSNDDIYGTSSEGHGPSARGTMPAYLHFLRLPLEVRERIYDFLLIHTRSILVDHQWTRVQRNSPKDNNIIRTCKQIMEECSNFLYKKNIFATVIRRRTGMSINRSINPRYLRYIRNVIIWFPQTSCTGEFQELGISCIQKLITCGTILESLTIGIAPRETGLTHPESKEAKHNPITFADFFNKDTKFMEIIQRLPCNTLNIIISKLSATAIGGLDDEQRWKQYLIKLDKRSISTDDESSWLFGDRAAMEGGLRRASRIKEQLDILQGRIQETFENEELACEAGICRMLDGPERLEQVILGHYS